MVEISRVLEETARIVREHAGARGAEQPEADDAPPTITADAVRSLVIVRQLRREFFATGSGGAAWTIMLHLYSARLDGMHVHQRPLAKVAGVAETTSVRLVRSLTEAGLVTIAPNPERRRGLVVGLTDEAAERMREYLAIALELAPLV